MNDSEKLVERTVKSEEVFDGALLHVFRDEARLPDGSTSVREWIRHPGASAVLPVFDNGEVMLVKQFRYPLSQIFYEVPAGKIDPDETADQTARRELTEETGLVCDHFHYIGHFHPSVGYTDEVIHLYTAWGIQRTDQKADEDEFLLTEQRSFREVVEMVHSGEISDGKTMVAVLRAWHWWQQEGPFRV